MHNLTVRLAWLYIVLVTPCNKEKKKICPVSWLWPTKHPRGVSVVEGIPFSPAEGGVVKMSSFGHFWRFQPVMDDTGVTLKRLRRCSWFEWSLETFHILLVRLQSHFQGPSKEGEGCESTLVNCCNIIFFMGRSQFKPFYLLISQPHWFHLIITSSPIYEED